MFKLEVEDDRGIWSDARGADGKILMFEKEDDARAKLSEMYHVLVQMEKYGDRKRTRVVRVFGGDKEWEEGRLPH